MERVKKVSIVILKIVLIVFLVVSFNLIMMPKYIDENQDGRVVAEMYREKLSPDIVFVGSSTVYSGIIPAKLYEFHGQTSYVCSTSSQTSWDSYYLLKEAVSELNPKMVVFDIGFLTTKEDYAEEVSNRKAFDYMKYTRNRFEAIDRAMAEGESKWSYVLPVLRYHERYMDLSLDDFKYAYYKPDVTYNGYVMNVLGSSELPEKLSMEEAENISLNACNAEYLQKIISFCKEKDIKLMLIKTPSYQAKWGTDYETAIVNIANANGIDYVNFDIYSDMMGIDWYNDSPDSGRHLNLFGAEKFSYYLGFIISGYYDVPDRRIDDKYNTVWEAKLNRYEADKESRIHPAQGDN